jgi:hypothetical protein
MPSGPAVTDVESALNEAAAGRRAFVKHRGRRVALVPAADLERLERLLDSAEIRAALAEGPALPYEDLRKQFGLA